MPSQLHHRSGVISGVWTATAIVVWSTAVMAVLWWVTSYEFSTTETEGSAAITRWPADTELKLSKERPTLLFFMHPKCPCTRASLTELRELLEGSTLTDDQLPDVTVVISQPADADPTWLATDTVRSAATLPRTVLHADINGVESDRFGIHISGAVMLFSRTGVRLFAGGITASRGHEGDSAGDAALRQLLGHEAVAIATTTPVFGCKLCTAPEHSAKHHSPSDGGRPSSEDAP